MDNNKPTFITDPYDGYLTEAARNAIQLLKDAGMDKDLALATLETLWEEEKIFDV